MPLAGLLKIHKITVLVPTNTPTRGMGVKYGFKTGPTLDCRVVPMRGTQKELFLQRGFRFPHNVFFLTNPLLDERYRFTWKGTVFRIDAPPVDPHGLDRFWVLDAYAMPEDNPAVAPGSLE